MEYEVRRLQTKDLFRVAKIIRQCTGPVRAAMGAAMVVTDPETGQQGIALNDPAAIGFALFEAMVDQDAAIKELFADLVGMKPEKFDREPFDALVVILERVMEQDDLPAFLSRVTGLASKISGERSISSSLATVGATMSS